MPRKKTSIGSSPGTEDRAPVAATASGQDEELERLLTESRAALEAALRRCSAKLRASLANLAEEAEARKRAEEAQRESEERFHSLLNELEDVVWAAAGDGVTDFFINDACARLYGRSVDEFRDNPGLWLEAIHPDDVERVERELVDFLKQGRIQQRYRIVRTDGDVRWLSDRKYVQVDENGKPSRMGGIASDITARVQAQEEREAFVQELEAKNSELERFAYTVSHDLKAPLVTIGGFTSELEKDIAANDSERIRKDISYIRAASTRMHELLTDLLDLSRIGSVTGSFEMVSLSEVAQLAAEMVVGRLDSDHVEVEIDPALPMVSGDRSRLLEVYLNLMENALKFSGEQAAPRVEAGVRQEAGETVFFVKDNGLGIDARYKERVFDLFQQLDAEATGTGIGLSLVKRIVEVHGGRVWVDSAGKGHGSTFCFTLSSKAVPEDAP